KRRITLGVAAVALCAAIGVGGWFATSGDDPGSAPEDTRNSAPTAP
ncbi:serine/threonine protein kinase, partial [Streptomyces sp. FT05W]